MRYTEVDKSVRESVKKNNGYCPCEIEQNDDTRCMCKAFREAPAGTVCHCGRFKKEEDE